jgi:hypothetical protein
MFDLYCHICGMDHEVGSESVLSAHRISDGTIAYVRCPEGHTVVVDFADLDPYQAHKRNRGVTMPVAA